MRDFIVRVSGGGQERWITVTASSQADARSRVTQAGSGWTAVAVYDTIADARSSNLTNPGLLSQIDAAEAQGFQSLGTLRHAEAGSTSGFEDWAPDATDSALRREAFEFGPGFEAGLSRRGINIGPGGGLEGRIAQNRQRALEDRFYTQQALTPGSDLTTETAHPTFQSFLTGRTGTGGDAGWTNPLFGQAGAAAAKSLLEAAQGFTEPQNTLPSALAGSVLNPATVGQGQTLANIALDAGRQRFGSLSRFLPSAGDLSQSFLAQDRPMAGTFADYLNQRIFG